MRPLAILIWVFLGYTGLIVGFFFSALAQIVITIWATWESVPLYTFAQRRLKSAFASAQSDQSLLFAWTNFAPLAVQNTPHWLDCANAQTDLNLRRAHMSEVKFSDVSTQIIANAGIMIRASNIQTGTYAQHFLQDCTSTLWRFMEFSYGTLWIVQDPKGFQADIKDSY